MRLTADQQVVSSSLTSVSIPLMKKAKYADIGIIVGRFHVDELHQAHCKLIDMAVKNHGRVAIVLGVAAFTGTKRNVFDFQTRQLMINAAYPNVVVIPIKDVRDDEEWSQLLDAKIREVFPSGTVMLYGGRDSFIKQYTGHFNTMRMEADSYVSGSRIREDISKRTQQSREFRQGFIAAVMGQRDNALPTVDIAPVIVNEGKAKVLLGKKPGYPLFRFIGGFVDSTDKSLEEAAKRELLEEAGANINVGDELTYVCSGQIDDWRLRADSKKIISTLFVVPFLWGAPEPGDDIEEVRWFKIADVKIDEEIVEEHRPFFRKFKAFMVNYAASVNTSKL